MSTNRIDLNDQLRTAIAESGLNRFQLARQSDSSYSVIHESVSGKLGLTLATTSRIHQMIGMELRPTQKGRSSRNRGG